MPRSLSYNFQRVRLGLYRDFEYMRVSSKSSGWIRQITLTNEIFEFNSRIWILKRLKFRPIAFRKGFDVVSTVVWSRLHTLVRKVRLIRITGVHLNIVLAQRKLVYIFGGSEKQWPCSPSMKSNHWIWIPGYANTDWGLRRRWTRRAGLFRCPKGVRPTTMVTHRSSCHAISYYAVCWKLICSVLLLVCDPSRKNPKFVNLPLSYQS